MKVRNKEATTSSDQLGRKPDVVGIATNIKAPSIQLSELAATLSRRNILAATAAGAIVAAAKSGQAAAASANYPTNPVIYIDDFARAHFTTYSDWTPIVAAALASFDHMEDGVTDSPGGTIVFGPSPGLSPLTDGTYNFLSPAILSARQGFGIELNRAAILRGTGGRTVLNFAVGLGGIRANAKGHPLKSDGSGSGLLGAYGWKVQDLTLVGNNGGNITQSPATAHGIYADINGTIRDCHINCFSGNGIMLHGNPDGTGADFDHLENVDVSWVNGCGIWIEGHDANNPLLVNCRSHKNPTPGTYGFYFNTLCGVTMIGGQMEANANDCWAAAPPATDTFFGVYKESGEPVTIGGNAVVVGGTLACDLQNNPTVNTLYASGVVPTVIGGAGVISWLRAQTDTARIEVGSCTGKGAMLALADRRENDGAWPYRFASGKTGGIAVDYGGTGVPVLTFLNSRCLKTNGFPVDAAKIPEFANGGLDIACHLTGDNNHKIFVGVTSSAPTSTAYPVGSIFHNNAAANVGDPLLWKLVNRYGALRWVVGATLQY